MLPKKIRLTTAIFDQVFKTGKVQHSRSFWMRSFALPVGLPSQFAVAVSKKVTPTAVLRNKIKRIVYQSVEAADTSVLADRPGNMVIFGVKSDISNTPFDEINKEIQSLLLNKGQK